MKLSPNTIVYTNVNHVSQSGMTRAISLFIVEDNEIVDISHKVARLLGMRISPRYGGIVTKGAGMDMGFHLVYNLGHHLFPDGYACTGTNDCRSNDHTNGQPRELGTHHASGGYALIHRTL